MKFFSDNVIFFDAEFSELNPHRGEIISVGLVKLNGEEFYCELEYQGKYSEWVKKNVLPLFKGPKLGKKIAKEKIKEFIGESRPYAIAYVNSLDMVFWSKLFANENKHMDWIPPFHWIPIDFASILFSLGMDPEEFYRDNFSFANKLGIDIDNHKMHNALDDARLLRKVYLKIKEKYEI